MSLVLLLATPIVLMLLLGYGLSFDIRKIPVCVFDREGSQASESFLYQLKASRYFSVVRACQGYAELDDAIDHGICHLGVAIPHDYSHQLGAQGIATIQAVIDSSDQNTAAITKGYLEALVADESTRVLYQWAADRKLTRLQPPIAVDLRAWFNQDLASVQFVVPAIVVIVLAIAGTLLSSATVAREWERGTMEYLLSTPISRLEIVLGKLIPYLLFGVFEAVICMVIAIGWFGLQVKGGYLPLVIGTFSFLMVALGFGLLFSVITRTQLGASQLALVTSFFPAAFLSGAIYPIRLQPKAIQLITYAVPARYYSAVLRGSFLRAAGLGDLAGDLAVLMMFAAAILALTIRRSAVTLD